MNISLNTNIISLTFIYMCVANMKLQIFNSRKIVQQYIVSKNVIICTTILTITYNNIFYN